jgi:hypothetical protein
MLGLDTIKFSSKEPRKIKHVQFWEKLQIVRCSELLLHDLNRKLHFFLKKINSK